MIICLEVPTNVRAQFEQIKAVAAACEDERIRFCLNLNGPAFSHGDTLITRNLIAFYYRPRIIAPSVSMMELRAACAKEAGTFRPTHRIISDGNFGFGRGWEAYLVAACEEMDAFEDATGFKTFLGMNGAFGSKAGPPKAYLTASPQMETQRGIIYKDHSWPWDEIAIHPGGFEDHYLSAFLLLKRAALPLKRFKSPIRHPKKRHFEYDDDIHDRTIWSRYNLQEVRDLYGDQKWSLPIAYGQSDRSQDDVYYYKHPHVCGALMCEIRDRFLHDPRLSHLVTELSSDVVWRRSVDAGRRKRLITWMPNGEWRWEPQ